MNNKTEQLINIILTMTEEECAELVEKYLMAIENKYEDND